MLSGLAGDARVGMDLLQHLVDVDAVALPPPLPSLLVTTASGLGLAGSLLRSLRCWLWSHASQATRQKQTTEMARLIVVVEVREVPSLLQAVAYWAQPTE